MHHYRSELFGQLHISSHSLHPVLPRTTVSWAPVAFPAIDASLQAPEARSLRSLVVRCARISDLPWPQAWPGHGARAGIARDQRCVGRHGAAAVADWGDVQGERGWAAGVGVCGWGTSSVGRRVLGDGAPCWPPTGAQVTVLGGPWTHACDGSLMEHTYVILRFR